MFESDEFDVDEDFLKDVDEKVEEYFSQRNDSDSTNAEPSPKRHKPDNPPSDFSDINFDDEPDFVRNAGKTMETNSKESDDACLSSCQKMLTEVCDASQPPNCDENVEMRKNLALEILRKGALQVNSELKSVSWTSSPLRQISSTGERNFKNSNSPRKIDKNTNVDTFKKPAPRWRKSPAKTAAQESPKYRVAQRMTLVRKFPGPAGLLPDGPDRDVNNAMFLNRLDEHNTDIIEDLDDSRISEYCSQNTERMFSVGAWRSMLDDLPADFLKGHEIAAIKRRAKNNCGGCENSQISFLAGVVQRIDHSFDNPRLSLKDLSDSIDATMHRDISLAHPNIFEPGVVVLLRDVGLLCFQGSQKCLGSQFHVIISPKNLLAVYSEKSRLVTSPRMESLLGEAIKSLETPRVAETPKTPKNTENKKIRESNPIFADNSVEISDFESDDDEMAFATIDIGAVSDSQMAASFSDVTPDFVTNKKNRGVKNEFKSIGESSKVLKISKTVEYIEETAKNIEIRPMPITAVKSRLLQYRSKDVLTPPVADTHNAAKKKSPEVPKDEDDVTNFGTFADGLLDSDNDTEDEILSQLDVDSIVTSYNSRT